MAADPKSINTRNCFISVTGLFVDYIQKRLPGTEALEILDENMHSQIGPAHRVIGGVRREQHIFETIERVTFRERLFVKNIQRCASDSLGGQRGNQCGFHYHRSSAEIDD